MSTSTELNTTAFDFSATVNRAGIPVRNFRITGSTSTPMIESRGPTMPASQTNAVPFGRMRWSAVGTCVCVPTTAETRPSRYHAIAVFSLVASPCMSTTTGVPGSTVASRRSATRNGSSISYMKVRPIRLMTVRPPKRTMPRPGTPSG